LGSLTNPGVPVVNAGYVRHTEHTTPVRTTDPAVKGAAGLRSASYSGIGLRPFGRQACGASPIARLTPKRVARNSIK
jgi:hypothetical protein